MPSPVRYYVVKKMLELKGYVHARTVGSHHIFHEARCAAGIDSRS